MFRIFDLTFNSFDEVVTWAWDTYKIEAKSDIEPHMQKEAVDQLIMFIERLNHIEGREQTP
jgi:hypothetical protein